MVHHVNRHPNLKESTKDVLRLRKREAKQRLKVKRARLVVRNLPFAVTEESLKAHFEKFGEVDNVQLLKKEDGKLRGCGFVQFKLVQKAAKARHHLNGKPFLGRDISVDFALAKQKYAQIKDLPKDDEVKVKEEPIDVDESTDITKLEPIEIKEEVDVKSEVSNEDDTKSNKDVEEEEGNEESDGSDYDEIKEEKSADVSVLSRKPCVISNDVNEGKTIFVKNVPFSATNEDLKQVMRQFGPLFYALICMDKYTEHSKGTAFVKFQNQEDAEKALNAGTELTLLGQILDCHKALARNDIQQKTQLQIEEKKQPKDSRNLYLVKEGVILAGSKAAEGVSASDMAKRLQLEQYKTQMLRNLKMFISKERLVVHNLPPTWNDQKLRGLFQKYGNQNALILEARTMRDLRNVDANGVGRSKEFGFVTFKRHEDALAALRNLNNNPNIFSSNKRPIVAFSIENRTMIKAKQKRLEKSKLKNPKCKEYDPNVVKKEQQSNKTAARVDASEGRTFSGVVSKPGGPNKMRSRYNLKTQAQIHFENLKKEKKKKKFAKKTLKEKKEDFTKQPKQKITKKKGQDDDFAKIVSEYKKKLSSAPMSKKTKWYE